MSTNEKFVTEWLERDSNGAVRLNRHSIHEWPEWANPVNPLKGTPIEFPRECHKCGWVLPDYIVGMVCNACPQCEALAKLDTPYIKTRNEVWDNRVLFADYKNPYEQLAESLAEVDYSSAYKAHEAERTAMSKLTPLWTRACPYDFSKGYAATMNNTKDKNMKTKPIEFPLRVGAKYTTQHAGVAEIVSYLPERGVFIAEVTSSFGAPKLFYFNWQGHSTIGGYALKSEIDNTPTITLELTPEEAAALAALTDRIGGDPSTTARKHSDSVFLKIRNGMDPEFDKLFSRKRAECRRKITGGLTFHAENIR